MSFTSTWATADPDAQGGSDDPPAPGHYTVAILDAKAFTSKKGDDWVVIELRGLDGASTDHEWPMLQGFKSQEQANFTKRVCRDLGVDVDNVVGLEELDTALKEIVGRYFNVEVKQNGEYRNTYLQGPSEGVQGDLGDIAGAPQSSEPSPSATAGDDDDVPFRWRPDEGRVRSHAYNPFG